MRRDDPVCRNRHFVRIAAVATLCLASASDFAQALTLRETSFRIFSQPDALVYETTCSATICTQATPLDYPVTGSFEVDSRGGRLRGRAHLAQNDALYGKLTGIVSYSTMARVEIIMGAPITILDIASTGIMSRMSTVNSAMSSTVSPATTQSKMIVLLGGDSASTQSYTVAGVRGPLSVEEPIDRTVDLRSTFTQEFKVGVTYQTEISLRSEGSIGDSDFSHTIQFEDLRFYDLGGTDVTQWVDVTFEDPEFFLASKAPAAPVPEPGSYAMLGAGLALLAIQVRRRRPARAVN